MASFYDIYKKGKFLALILRHAPEKVGLSLDRNGWANVKDLLTKANFTIEKLRRIIETDDKGRFEFSADGFKVRACQGHSIGVDLDLSVTIPPEVLYHGTADRFINSIFDKGIIAKSRDMIHLSSDIETAIKVGSRHGKPIVLVIDTGGMVRDGYSFYISNNGVWLTKEVPVKYIKVLAD
jgi:putative RNA 2'-phosphotransferase